MTNDPPLDVRLALSAGHCLQEQDYPGAERFINRALAINPNCGFALNAHGLLLVRTGRETEATAVYLRAIALHPAEPNAYFNLASMHYCGGRLEETLAVLEQLFAKATCSSPVSAKIRSLAYRLCHQVQEGLAAKHHDAACGAVEGFRRSIEDLTGCPVVVRSEDLPEDRAAVTQIALGCGRRQHVIRCSPSFPSLLQPHLLAQQLMRLELAARASKTGKARAFTTTPATQPFLTRLVRLRRPHIRRLLDQGYDERAIARTAWDEVRALLLALHSCPLELLVETSLRERLPALASAQFLGMARDFAEARDPSEVLEDEHIIPRNLVRIGLAFDCVRAMHHGSLFANTSPLPLAYMRTEVYPLASKLWNCWQAAAPSLGPGDVNRLVDAFAEVVRLRQAYEWIAPPAAWPDPPNP